MNKNNLLIILLLPLFASCGKQAAVQEKAADGLMLTDSLQQVISIDTVRETALNNELLLNGRVTFDAGQVAHVYPIFGGTIAQVNVEIGDYIRKGDVLAVIRFIFAKCGFRDTHPHFGFSCIISRFSVLCLKAWNISTSTPLFLPLGYTGRAVI